VVCIIAGLQVHQSASQRALETYMAELRAKGEKLTYAELYPAAPARASSTSAALFRATANLKAGVIPPSSLELMNLVKAGQARVLWRAPTPSLTPSWLNAPAAPGKRSLSPSPAPTWTDLRDEMKNNEVSLTEIR